MPRLFDLLQVGDGSNSERSQNLPALLDLFRSNATSVNRYTAQLGSLYSAPAEPKWDIRSGKPEPGLGQVTPEEWLPLGAGMKLAALAKGLLSKAAIAGTFIGSRHPSWMKDAADEALRLKSQGVDPREIWARTRTFTEHPGVDAVQEISDRSAGWSKSTLSDLKNKFGSFDLTERAFDHPRLFIGPRHPSWMKDAADEALRLKSQGVDPREIWARTRTFTEHPGVDAVQEISDARAVVNRGAMRKPMSDRPDYFYTPGNGAPAEDLFPHPNLYRGYPELGEAPIKARIGNGIETSGAYYPRDGSMDASASDAMRLRGIITHEMQHGVQQAEGWPVGGNSASMLSDPQTRDYTINLAKEFESAGHAPADAYKKASYEAYRRLAGEAQAEAARARRSMTDAQLTQNYPGDSYPVPLKDLLIRR